jgi:hypothetical protein
MACAMFLVFVCHVVAPPAAEAAFGGRVAMYSDAGLSVCSLVDAAPQIADVYVVHITAGSVMESDASGIQLRLTSSAGFTGTWLEDVIPSGMSHAGTSQSGIGIGYGATCPTSGIILMLQARYQMHGTSAECSFVEAGPYPNLLSIASTTCYFFDELPVDGDRLQVNPDPSCSCEGAVATKPTTWGQIKAMYRE